MDFLHQSWKQALTSVLWRIVLQVFLVLLNQSPCKLLRGNVATTHVFGVLKSTYPSSASGAPAGDRKSIKDKVVLNTEYSKT